MVPYKETLPQQTAHLCTRLTLSQVEVPGFHLISLIVPPLALYLFHIRKASSCADKWHPQCPPSDLTWSLFGSVPAILSHQEKQVDPCRKISRYLTHSSTCMPIFVVPLCCSDYKNCNSLAFWRGLWNNVPPSLYFICWCTFTCICIYDANHTEIITTMLWRRKLAQ